MKNNNSTFIVLGGILVLSVFSFIVAKNILPDSDNNQYYARPNENKRYNHNKYINRYECSNRHNRKLLYLFRRYNTRIKTRISQRNNTLCFI